jgi:hypothetical protein
VCELGVERYGHQRFLTVDLVLGATLGLGQLAASHRTEKGNH